MVDISPILPGDRQAIEGYGGGGFRVSGVTYRGSVLVLPGRTLAWPVTDVDQVTAESFAAAARDLSEVEILLFGCGPSLVFVDKALRAAVRALGPVLEPMDTGAACRTYNVLLAEERRVAAALIAVE